MLSEFLRSWYVDSSPGNSFAQAKCGEIKVSTGLVGVSILSPVVGPPPPPPPGTPDIETASRSLGVPGTRLTPGTSFGFDMEICVWFDSQSALYNLPQLSGDQSSLSLSYWYNWAADVGSGEDNDNTSSGLLLGSPTKPCCTDTEVDAPCPDCPHDIIGGVDKPLGGATTMELCPTPQSQWRGHPETWVNTKASNNWTHASWSQQGWQDITPSEIGEMQGWAHVMCTWTVSGGQVYLTKWIDDTEICTNKNIGAITGNLPFGLRDFTGLNGKNHFWNIGGKPDKEAVGKSIIILSGNYYVDNASHTAHPGWPTSVQGTNWDCGFANLGPSINGCDTAFGCAEAYGYTNMGGSSSWAWGNCCGCQESNGYHATVTPGCLNSCGNFYCAPVSTSTCITGATCNYECTGGPSGGCGCPFNPSHPPDNGCATCACTGVDGCTWTVFAYGGKPNDDGFEPETKGDGFQGAVTELWIAPGQAVDWSIAANRYKFHNSDTGVDDWEHAELWGPVDLGSTGKGITDALSVQKSGTGTKPWIYLTGKPSEFNFNRARNMQRLQLYRNSSGGIVGELKAYFSVPVRVA